MVVLLTVSKDSADSKRPPVLKLWEQPQDKHSKVMQNYYI